MSDSFVEVLRQRSEEMPERVLFRFLPDGETEGDVVRFADLDRRARALAVRLVDAGASDQRVLILVPPGAQNVVSFFACLYAGAIAVPSAPPRRARADGKLRAIREAAGAAFVLTDAATRDRVARSGELPTDGNDGLRWIDVAGECSEVEDMTFAPRMPSPSDVAFLQFTSGSTGRPKGVTVSHGNLVANARLLEQSFADDERSVGVSWLPPYHDMGLIGGILQPVFLGVETVVMSPTAFVQRPLRWLEAISAFRGTTSGGPDFAYGLCADAAAAAPPDLDLSSWTLAFSGAEPVRAATLDRFARAFADSGFDPRAFYPCYGMAETTLFVSGGTRGAGARRLEVDPIPLEAGVIVPADGGRSIVSCGRPAVDALAIVDRETDRALPERAVGEVWVRGPQVALGYWDDPASTVATFGATLSFDDAGGDGAVDNVRYLRTGDLGFLDGGELFLTGRVKDLVILRGRNLHPSDLEETAARSHDTLRGAGVAAFSVDGHQEEELVLVTEVARVARRGLDAEAVGVALRRAIVDEHGADPLVIVFLRPGALPRTSSGKVMRATTRRAYEEGELPELARWSRPTRSPARAEVRARTSAPGRSEDSIAREPAPALSSVRDRLVLEVAAEAGVELAAIHPGEPWATHGLDSIQGVRLVGRVSDWLGRQLSPTLLFDHPTIDAFAAYLAGCGEGGAEESPSAERVSSAAIDVESDGIAVIGLAARFPGASDARSWFDALARGVDAVGPVPAERPGRDAWSAAAERTPAVARGGFLDEVDAHEVALFGLSPREARDVDPQQRLLLETAWRAFEDATIAPERLAGSSTGVFVGVSSPDYARLMAAGSLRRFPAHAGTGNALSVAANRISYTFDLRGPSLAVDTACSSSLVAVHHACASLRRGESELALAGGVNLMLAPDLSEIFAEAGMLSPEGRCRTFDAAADGYVRGEGCGLVVLKPLSRAQADGDRVLAVIRGSAVNQDGRSNGLTAPSGAAQERVIRAALADARFGPDDVDYVEAHGTGTPLGDPIEAEALNRVFGLRAASSGPLRIGSVKTNVGHLEAAAGIAGLVKVVLGLAHESLPGQLHFESPNPHAPIVDAASPGKVGAGDGHPLAVLTETVPWPAAAPRIAGVSSFGFGGTNAHVVVEGPTAPREDAPAPMARGVWLSERDPESLAALAGSAARALDQGGATLDGLAREAAVGRARLDRRIAVVAENAVDASRALAAFAGGRRAPEVIVDPNGGQVAGRATPRVAFAFPGQGVQRVRMGAELYSRDAAFRRRVDHCERVLLDAAGFSLLELLEARGKSAAARLAETRFTQPALFAVELSLAEVLVERGVRPERLIGHSVGEYAAACLAGVFERDDALRLIARRAELVGGLPEGGAMLAVRIPAARAASFVAGRDDVVVAVDNAPDRSVLSGVRGALEGIASSLAAEGVEARWLTVSHAFHSPLLDPIVDAFGEAVSKVRLSTPRIDVFSNLTGRSARGQMATPEYWVGQLRERVRFREGLASLFADPVDAVVEVGPRATTLALARAVVAPERADSIAWLPTLRDGVREDVGVARALGELFVRGAPLDGVTATDGARGRGPQLPGVRFRRERLWFRPGGAETHIGRASAGDHPLLGAALDLPGGDGEGLRFEASVGSDAPAWLEDHRVGASVVMPAVAFVEIALAAGRRAITEHSALEVRDLSIRAPLTVPVQGEVRLHTAATLNTRSDVRIRVYSADAAAERGTWVEHGDALISPGESAASLSMIPPAEGEERIVDLSELARSFEAAGLHYGDAFRGVERIVVHEACDAGTSVAVGVVGARPVVSEERYAVPPTRLDACLQTIAPLLSTEETLLPVGIRRFVALSPGEAWPERVEARAWLVGPREANVDVRTFSGEPIVRIEGVLLAPAAGLGDVAATPEDALHELEWIRRARSAGGRARLPEPASALDPLRSMFADEVAGDAVRRYRAGVDALEARARTLARGIVDQLDEAGERERAEDGSETKRVRLVARLRELANEAPTHPAAAVEDPIVDTESELLERCAARVVDVLERRCDPVAELLFPGGDANALRAIYRDAPGPSVMNAQVARVLAGALDALDRDEGIAVLEIGGGTGGTTEGLLELLPPERSSYLFTDLGAPLVQAAIERLGPRHPYFEGRVLDVSRDPSRQGFEPASADIAVAANVLHATPRLVETLAHVRTLLSPGGWLVLLEGTRRLGWLDLTFGLTDGWWCFDADAHRADHPLADSRRWRGALEEAGFESIASLAEGVGPLEQDVIVARAPEHGSGRVARVVSGSDRHPGLERVLAAAMGTVGKGGTNIAAGREREEAVVVARSFAKNGGVEDEDSGLELPERCELVMDEALAAVRGCLEAEGPGGRITFVTHGAIAVGEDGGWAPPSESGVAEAALWGVARALRLEQPGREVRVVDVDEGTSADAIARELAADDPEDEVVLRTGRRFVPRLARHVDRSRPTRLEVAVPGHLDQLVERRAERRAPDAGEVELEVRATGLNFRDLLQALGMLGEGYAAELDRDHVPFGFECAGEVVRVGSGVKNVSAGDAVIGCFTPGSLASYVTLPARFVVPKPVELDWAHAAALPTAWLTVWYALDTLAELKSQEWILVHAAAGGVGTAAVRHALALGARVIATAHPSKWEFLRAMGVEYVASSRDTAFAERVRAWTGGAGVDVVLNCLKDELALESLAVTAAGGRFVELGRVAGIDAALASERRPDVRHFEFDLGRLAIEGSRTLDALIQRFAQPQAAERLALPTSTFPLSEAESAFRRLQAGRHRGKLVLLQPAAHAGVEEFDLLGCYVLSGGTGGLGLAVARWLADRGVRHLALFARRAPSAEASTQIDQLVQSGVRVDVTSVDVADRAAVRLALARLRDGGATICGVIHGAGVLADGLLPDLDQGRVRRVFDPKVRGVHNLAVETASDPLDVFMSFSSAAALFGSPGQANHAAANAVLDAHAARLRGDGRPGQSLAWGAWARIGAAARKGAGDRLAAIGIGEIEPTEGLTAFGDVLGSGAPYVGVAPIEWQRFAQQAFSARPFYARRLAAAARRATPASGPTLDLSGMDGAARREALDRHLRAEIATVLGLSSPDAVEVRGRLMDLGMDSLMAVELKARLERSLGLALQTTLLFDHPTVESLIAYLDGALGSGNSAPDVVELEPRPAELNVSLGAQEEGFEDEAALFSDLESLSDEDVVRQLRG